MFTNKWFNKIRRWLGLPYWSVSAILKKQVKQAASYIGNFETFLAKHAISKECDGVICGHIHVPDIKEIQGIQYYNCGDWMENCTGLIEHYDGTIELVHLHT